MSIAAASGCESATETPATVRVDASLTGASIKPTAIETDATGSFTASISALGDSASLTYDIEFAGLDSNSTAAHVHGPADENNTGAVLVDLTAIPPGGSGTVQLGGTSGTGSGIIDLKADATATVSGDSLHTLLLAGRLYVDVHSSANAAGEIRGQLRRR
jgi:hypothetical protein